MIRIWNNNEYGNFSLEHLQAYCQRNSIREADLETLRTFGPEAPQLLASLCGAPLPKGLFDLIRQFGYHIGAIRMECFDWELACLISGRPSFIEILRAYGKSKCLRIHLSTGELLLINALIMGGDLPPRIKKPKRRRHLIPHEYSFLYT